MSELPCNHHTKFRAEWWNERRKRDYYIDAEGCVHLRCDSETGRALEAQLMAEAERLRAELMDYALLVTPPEGHA